MYSRLGISVEDGEPDYAKLKAAIREKTELPLVFDNSVKGTAMANIDFLKTKDINRHNIAFLQYGNTMHFVVTNLNDPIVSYDNRTNFVDKMIINPYSDRTCPCGRRGVNSLHRLLCQSLRKYFLLKRRLFSMRRQGEALRMSIRI